MIFSRWLLSVVLSHTVRYQTFAPFATPPTSDGVAIITPSFESAVSALALVPADTRLDVCTLSPSDNGSPIVMVGIRAYGSPIDSVSVQAESLLASGSVSVKAAVSTGNHASPADKDIDASSEPMMIVAVFP